MIDFKVVWPRRDSMVARENEGEGGGYSYCFGKEGEMFSFFYTYLEWIVLCQMTRTDPVLKEEGPNLINYLLVPRGRPSFGQLQESWPLTDPTFWACAEFSFRILSQSDMSDLTESPWICRSRFLMLTKRRTASGDDNGLINKDRSKPTSTDQWRMTNFPGILQPIPSRIKWPNRSDLGHHRPNTFPLTLKMTSSDPLLNAHCRGTTDTPGVKPFAEILTIDSTYFVTSGTIFPHKDRPRPVNNTSI